MAHFRATIRGQRGEASRLGSKNGGITAHVNGWKIGIEVVGYCRVENGKEKNEFTVRITNGSGGGFPSYDVTPLRGSGGIINGLTVREI